MGKISTSGDGGRRWFAQAKRMASAKAGRQQVQGIFIEEE